MSEIDGWRFPPKTAVLGHFHCSDEACTTRVIGAGGGGGGGGGW